MKVSHDLHASPFPYYFTERKLCKINTWWQLGKQKEGYLITAHHVTLPSIFFVFWVFLARRIQNWNQYSCSKLKTSSAFCLFQLFRLCSVVAFRVVCLFGSREPTSPLWTIITDILHQERETKMGKVRREGLWNTDFLSRCDLPAHSGLSSLKLIAKSWDTWTPIKIYKRKKGEWQH